VPNTPEAHSSPAHTIRLSEVLAGLSCALDLTEGQRPGHAARSCLIGMRLADEIGLQSDQRSALFYGLLLKDLGCSSNAARFAALFAADDHTVKAGLKTVDWTQVHLNLAFIMRNVAPGQFWMRRVWQTLAMLREGPAGAKEVVRTRCERGADIARLLGFTPETVEAIRALDEHWDGHGQPYNLRGQDIPLLGRILSVAQTAEVFFSTYGPNTALDIVSARKATWFDPDLVAAMRVVGRDHTFWETLESGDTMMEVARVEPADRVLAADEAKLDNVTEAFARVIDAKSPWTYDHSNGVARVADRLAESFGLSAVARRDLRRAAQMHDLGKLGVSNLILDKPGRLTDDELAVMRRHPSATFDILHRVGCFRHLAPMAAAHHERLDGGGYHQGLDGSALSIEARILCIADITDALTMSRPYREGLSPERVLEILGRDIGTAVDADCYEALKALLIDAPQAPAIPTPRPTLDPALAEDYTQAA
jgi:HD-GYP domain-containing protein (c-di-GMP phosphodiesterase class II)